MVKNDAESAAYAVERLLRQGLGCESFTGSSGRCVQVQPTRDAQTRDQRRKLKPAKVEAWQLNGSAHGLLEIERLLTKATLYWAVWTGAGVEANPGEGSTRQGAKLRNIRSSYSMGCGASMRTKL